MKTDQVLLLTNTFEGHAQQTESGVEYWLARDVQHLLGYAEWRNFTAVLGKAETACEVSGHLIADHFVAVNKMANACYLITLNGELKELQSHRGLWTLDWLNPDEVSRSRPTIWPETAIATLIATKCRDRGRQPGPKLRSRH